MPSVLSNFQARTAIPLNVYLVMILGVFAISWGAIFARLAQGEDMPSLLVALGRVGIATLILTPLVLSRYRVDIQRLNRRDVGLALSSGFFLALHFITWTTSLEYTTVLISVVLVSTVPIWVALLEVLLLKERLSQLVILGLVIAISGSLLITFGSPTEGETTLANRNDLLGGALALFGAITVSTYLVIGRKLREKVAIIPYIWLVYGCATLVIIVIVLVTQTPVMGYSINGYVFLVGLAIIPQLLGHSSLNYILGYLPATFVSLIAQLESVGSAIIAFLLFNETPLLIQLVGSGVVLVGVTLATFGQQKQRKAEA